MKTTQDNYFDQVKEIGLHHFSDVMKKGHDFIEKATKSGKDWSRYEKFKKQFDNQFLLVDGILKKLDKKGEGKPGKTEKPKKEKEVKKEKSQKKTSGQSKKEKQAKEPKRKKEPKPEPENVSFVRFEIQVISKWKNMLGKVKTRQQIANFISWLQKLIQQRKIRKTSEYAPEIQEIQQDAIYAHATMKDGQRVPYKEDRLAYFKLVAATEKQRPIVRFMARYSNMAGKVVTKEQVHSLHTSIARALQTGAMDGDPDIGLLKLMAHSLERFYHSKKPEGILEIHEATLQGIKGVLNGCGCDELGGTEDESEEEEEEYFDTGYVPPGEPEEHTLCALDEPAQEPEPPAGRTGKQPRESTMPKTMNSTDFVNVKFKALPFEGKYAKLYGRPAPGFRVLITALEKMGKSTLSIDTAGYLARNFGRVLYLADEEKLSATLQEKLKRLRAAHPNLTVTEVMPEDWFTYDFIFFDSVSSLGFSMEDLLKYKTPTNSCFYIFHSTKDGKHMGSNTFAHYVDQIVKFKDKGIAYGYGRYGGGEDVNVFEE